MRIGIDIRELEKGKMTGIGRCLLNFLEYINQSDQRNEYIIFANQNTNLPVLRSDIKLKVIFEFSKIYWDQIILTKQIKREKVDIFYSPFYKGPIFSPARLIVTCHDLHFLKLTSIAIGNSLRKYYCRLSLQRADTIITVSEYSKRTIHDFLGNKSKRIEVVYDSAGEEFRPLDETESLNKIKKTFGLKDNFILCVGNLKPHKNLVRLFEAYSLLPLSLRECYQLAVAGKKDENYSRLWKIVEGKNLKDNIIFLDLVDDKDLVCLYNASCFLVFVSLCEGFGLPALEAMACGTPTLVSNSTSLPELVGNASLLVDPYDVNKISQNLEKLLTDEVLRETLSKKGLLRARDFSVKNMAEKILKIFKENHK